MVKDAARVFYRSKLLIGIALLTLPFCGCYAFRYYGRTGIGMIPAQLQQALSLSLYLFIITMFLSYEYHKKLKATGIAEAAAATPKGKNGQPFWSAGIVLSIWICMVTLLLIVCVILCDYILVMKSGKIIGVYSPEQPADEAGGKVYQLKEKLQFDTKYRCKGK